MTVKLLKCTNLKCQCYKHEMDWEIQVNEDSFENGNNCLGIESEYICKLYTHTLY